MLRAASASPPLLNLHYRTLSHLLASRWLCQHTEKPAAKGMGNGGEARRERGLILRHRLRILVG